MTPPRRRDPGYSLLEMMLVLSILGVLSAVGASQVRVRTNNAVVGLMDELEGALSQAHRAAAATGRDMAILTSGTWEPASPAQMAFGDASLSDADLAAAAAAVGQGMGVDAALGAAGGTVAVPFRLLAGDRVHAGARVVALGSSQWTNALQPAASGASNGNLSSKLPFKAGGAMDGVVSDDRLLFTGGSHRVVVSGTSKRFTETFIIPVVGTTSSGSAAPGAPMGLLVVLANGASVYKFYNPGARDGDGQWRRM